MFSAPWFILGGGVAAAAVVVIHILHRRRFRVVRWAAMQFLFQAARRSRRLIELRDWLLLLLRVACLGLFAVGMARPHWGQADFPSAALATHLVIVIDNSLSMAFRDLGRALWEDVKQGAISAIRALPPDSRVSVVPLVRVQDGVGRCEFAPPEEAREFLNALQIVEQRGDLRTALIEAGELCRRFPEPVRKRLVVFSDFQRSGVGGENLGEVLRNLPVAPEAVAFSPPVAENTWISQVESPERYLQVGSTVRIRARIRHEGARARLAVPVTLTVRGNPVATVAVDLHPGQEREVEFPPYSLVTPPQEGDLSWLEVRVALPPDSLPEDDSLTVLFPVFGNSPIVFVDQYGPEEDPAHNRFGETYLLRRLLATSFETAIYGTLEKAHLLEDLSPALLGPARVVVIAGVRDPTPRLGLLAEFVRQGGNLVIAAGGEFDPTAWVRACMPPYALLPGRLRPSFVGRLPLPGAGQIQPFRLDLVSCRDECFEIEGFTREELAQFYQPVFFFQAVELDLDADSGAPAEQARFSAGQPTVSDPGDEPRAGGGWLTWRRQLLRETVLPDRDRPTSESKRPADGSPRPASETPKVEVLARYSNGLPFMVEQTVGDGRTVFITTGVFRDWNTLPASYAVVIFDRLLRRLVDSTCPRRNLTTGDVFRLVVDNPQTEQWQLVMPDGATQPVVIGAMGTRHHGITLQGFPRRGLYRLIRHEISGDTGGISAAGNSLTASQGTASQQSPSERASVRLPGPLVEEVLLAVRGPEEESIPDYLSAEEIKDVFGRSQVVWSDGRDTSLAGRQREWWPWLVLAALVGLIGELGLLARSSRQAEAGA